MSQQKNDQQKPKSVFPELETSVLQFWQEHKIFEQSLQKDAPKGEYVFYDGPPFATGTPHYGHLVASIMKDAVPRFWTMQGYRVERTWGWDCHGLPIENIVEKEMGSKSKKDIEAVGVAEFNERCRSKVLSYADEWKKTIPRLGRWADMDHPYSTMDRDYMESIWWVFKELWDNDLVYRDYKSMHICPRCETTLSQQEVAEGYKDVKDLSVTAKFKLDPGQKIGDFETDENTYALAWTTTPWTLPGNVALAVGKDIAYALVKHEDATYIVAKERLAEVMKDTAYETVSEVRGSALVGLEYQPPFDYYSSTRNDVLDSAGDGKKIAVAFVVREGKVLLGLREYTKDKRQSDFQNREIKDFLIAPGGRSEAGETLRETIARELQEEIGITNFTVQQYLGVANGYLSEDEVHAFLIDIGDAAVQNNEPDKFKEWSFFDVDEIPADKLMRESDREWLRKAIQQSNAWKIYPADFITTDTGTGIAHEAPAFGEEDMQLAREKNLPLIHHVNFDGTFKDEVADFKGLHVKPIEDVMQTDVAIIKYLAHNGLLFHKEKYEHSYPHCWRCDTPLLNYATSSWFVKVAAVKDKALAYAKQITWTPEHMKEGRFGNWLESARDWSISRQRFWASVMPVWHCAECHGYKAFGSVAELEEQMVPRNTFYYIRHGESEKNVQNIASAAKDKNPLTEQGRVDVQAQVVAAKKANIDMIVTSDVLRARQTAEIIGEAIGVDVVVDPRLTEVNLGMYEERSLSDSELQAALGRMYAEPAWAPEGAESLEVIQRRMLMVWSELNYTHQGKNILLVSHGDTLHALQGQLRGVATDALFGEHDYAYPQTAALQPLPFTLFDLHKHVVDAVQVPCEQCNGLMQRIPDVLDTWFDSGSMPYAQMHYPFENEEKFERNFPAEFIAEGVDQTRAWFYYLHVLAAALKGKPAFKNVIVNGIVLAEDGQKMSKKLQNYPDPNVIMEQYGADALRYYLLTSPVVLAEDFSFSERGVQEAMRKVNMLVWNVLQFYELFTNNGTSETNTSESDHILDRWIVARLNQLIAEVTKHMQAYNLPKATRPIAEFVDDLSTWYIRRSRERFKSDDEADKQAAIATTRHMLVELATVMAPFMPFLAEIVWQKVTGNDLVHGEKSVHLEAWPTGEEVDEYVLSAMQRAREIVEIGLAQRDAIKIKVRQPLASATVIGSQLPSEYRNLIRDELNVKDVVFKEGEALSVTLDTDITEELKAEGLQRELVRTINGLRKKAGLTINDRATVYYTADSDDIASVFTEYAEALQKDTLSDALMNKEVDGMEEVAVNGETVALKVIAA